jgi:hypothetical protein
LALVESGSVDARLITGLVRTRPLKAWSWGKVRGDDRC